MRCFVDTNVLLYAFDDEEPVRQATARQLIKRLGDEKQGLLSTQVLLELFNALVRKFRVSARTASLMVAAFCEWPVVDADAALVMRAMARSAQDQLSIWEAMMVEAALRGGAAVLYSEDMQAGRRYGSLLLENPFA